MYTRRKKQFRVTLESLRHAIAISTLHFQKCKINGLISDHGIWKSPKIVKTVEHHNRLIKSETLTKRHKAWWTTLLDVDETNICLLMAQIGIKLSFMLQGLSSKLLFFWKWNADKSRPVAFKAVKRSDRQLFYLKYELKGRYSLRKFETIFANIRKWLFDVIYLSIIYWWNSTTIKSILKENG